MAKRTRRATDGIKPFVPLAVGGLFGVAAANSLSSPGSSGSHLGGAAAGAAGLLVGVAVADHLTDTIERQGKDLTKKKKVSKAVEKYKKDAAKPKSTSKPKTALKTTKTKTATKPKATPKKKARGTRARAR